MNRRLLIAAAAVAVVAPAIGVAVPAAAVDGVLITTAPNTTSQPWRLEVPAGDPAPIAQLVDDGDEPSAYDGYLYVKPGAGTSTEQADASLHRTPPDGTTLRSLVGLKFQTLDGSSQFLQVSLDLACRTGGEQLTMRTEPTASLLDGSGWTFYDAINPDTPRWALSANIEPDGTLSQVETGAPGELTSALNHTFAEIADRCTGGIRDESVSWRHNELMRIDGLTFDDRFNFGVDQMGGTDQQVERMRGADRIATSAAAAVRTWDGQQADAVVLASSDAFADSLAGSALAVHWHGPLLLTSPTALRADTASAIRRVAAPGTPVFILGGTKAVADKVATQVKGLGMTPTRYWGADRYATAVGIATKQSETAPTAIFLADGTDFPDGLAAGVPAGLANARVLLTNHDKLPAATAAYLDKYPQATVIAVGGPAAHAAGARVAADNRIVGVDRYETALAIARRYFLYFSYNRDVAIIASGENWPDGLSGAAVAGAYQNPLILTPRLQLTDGTAQFLRQESAALGYAFVLGGTSAVSEEIDLVTHDAIGTH
ncbi:MAG: cell wall-binding repeat-containing protein [Actinomycetes bacterium]